MKIQVTSEDILTGQMSGKVDRCWCCPIALAIQRVVQKKVFVSSFYFHQEYVIAAHCEIDGKRYNLPTHIAEKIRMLDRDRGTTYQPFEFELSTQSRK